MVTLVDPRRLVPRTDVVLTDPRLTAAQRRLGRGLVLAAVREAQDQARSGTIAAERVADEAVAALPALATTLTPVINATGVLLHTNLGRAQLSAAAREAVVAAAVALTATQAGTFAVRPRRRDKRFPLTSAELAVLVGREIQEAHGLDVNLSDGVLSVTIDRPDSLNSVNAAVLAGIADAMESAATDPRVQVVRFGGAGRGFCSGAGMSADDLANGGPGAEIIADRTEIPRS